MHIKMSQSGIIKEKLDYYLKTGEIESQKIFDQLSLLIFSSEAKGTDLNILAQILPTEYLMKMINYYNGDLLRLPTKEQFQDCLLLSICFYLKQIKGMSWPEIKEFMDLPDNEKDMISSISLGCQINKIQENLNKEMLNLLKQLDLKDVDTFVKSLSRTGSNHA